MAYAYLKVPMFKEGLVRCMEEVTAEGTPLFPSFLRGADVSSDNQIPQLKPEHFGGFGEGRGSGVQGQNEVIIEHLYLAVKDKIRDLFRIWKESWKAVSRWCRGRSS